MLIHSKQSNGLPMNIYLIKVWLRLIMLRWKYVQSKCMSTHKVQNVSTMLSIYLCVYLSVACQPQPIRASLSANELDAQVSQPYYEQDRTVSNLDNNQNIDTYDDRDDDDALSYDDLSVTETNDAYDLGVDTMTDLSMMNDAFVYTPVVTDEIETYNVVELVDPMIATGGMIAEIANVTPAASAPLGMTLVGPDTRLFTGMFAGYHCAGYHYADTHIQGFSHTHAHGMGVVDYGGISIMPRLSWQESYQTFDGRQAPFAHEEEWSSPGYYGVQLQDDATQVHVVATPHGAHHRYLFDQSEANTSPVVIIDLADHLKGTNSPASSLWADESNLADLNAYQVVAGQYSKRFGGVMHHAAVRFDPPPIAMYGWSAEQSIQNGYEFTGEQVGAYVAFAPGTQQVDVRVAISYVDIEGAWNNLQAELPNLDQEERLSIVQNHWQSLLSRIKVRGQPQDVRRFSTAHYHSLLMPSLHSDVDGRYRGVDQEIHQADFDYYSDLSLWDTFRTLHPFYLIAHPDLQLDMLKSLVQMSIDGGALPRWPLAHGYTGGMVGSPATQVFAGSYLKGLQSGWDVQQAFDIALAHASGTMPHANRRAIIPYLNVGWVPADEYDASVSLTLEYAWSDFSLALWAQEMNHPSADSLFSQSQSWHNHWHANAGFMVGKNRDGSWQWDDRPSHWNSLYVEGNAWHYLWYVPYDVPDMIQVQHQGDKEAFLQRLTTYWEDVFAEEDDLLPDEFYWHGNEPVMHYAWLASLAGNHALTVHASHWILEHRYGHDAIKGLDGNDDSGTLSAWYLLAAMGFYPIAGTDFYALGAPIFERVEINSAGSNGEDLVIQAPGTDWYKHPHHVAWKDQVITEPVITHSMLQNGLTFFYD